MSEDPTEKDEPGDGTECSDSERIDRARESAKTQPPVATEREKEQKAQSAADKLKIDPDP
jgi:hypothetical protein